MDLINLPYNENGIFKTGNKELSYTFTKSSDTYCGVHYYSMIIECKNMDNIYLENVNPIHAEKLFNLLCHLTRDKEDRLYQYEVQYIDAKNELHIQHEQGLSFNGCMATVEMYLVDYDCISLSIYNHDKNCDMIFNWSYKDSLPSIEEIKKTIKGI